MIKVDQTLLDRSPLSDYERSLITKIDIEEKTVTEVADEVDKDKSTVSVQHKAALERLSKWSQGMVKEAEYGPVAAQVFELFRRSVKPHNVVIRLKLRPSIVSELWDQYRELTGHTTPLCYQCYGKGYDDGIEEYVEIR